MNTQKHRHKICKKQAHLILATALTGVCAVSSLATAEVSGLALALVPASAQGEKDVYDMRHAMF